jgi:hypothetical protein
MATRWLDLLVLAAAFPFFLVLGLPVAGWGAAAAIWVAQRALQIAFQRRADASGDPKAVVGYTAGGALVRGWGAALAVLVVGIKTDDETGLSAAALILALFTVYFATKVLGRLAGRER